MQLKNVSPGLNEHDGVGQADRLSGPSALKPPHEACGPRYRSSCQPRRIRVTLAWHKCSHVSYTVPPVPPGPWAHDQVHPGHGSKGQAAMNIRRPGTGREGGGRERNPDRQMVTRAAEE